MKTKPNKTIEEIRETRRRISARYGHDPKRLVGHYIKRQQSRKATTEASQKNES